MDNTWQQEWSQELCEKLKAASDRLPHRVALSRTSNYLIGPGTNNLRGYDCWLSGFRARRVSFSFSSLKGNKSCEFHLYDPLVSIRGQSPKIDDAVEVAITWMNNGTVEETRAQHPSLAREIYVLQEIVDNFQRRLPDSALLKVRYKYKPYKYDRVDLIIGNRCVEIECSRLGGVSYEYFQNDYLLASLERSKDDYIESIFSWLIRTLSLDEMKLTYPEIIFMEGIGDPENLSAEWLFGQEWKKFRKKYESCLDKNLNRGERVLQFYDQVARSPHAQNLRPGTSMLNLILSRARQYHLKPDQKRIGFYFDGIEDGIVSVGHNLHGDWQSFMVTEFNSTVEALMAELAAVEID